jgi:hypothetical protein
MVEGGGMRIPDKILISASAFSTHEHGAQLVDELERDR